MGTRRRNPRRALGGDVQEMEVEVEVEEADVVEEQAGTDMPCRSPPPPSGGKRDSATPSAAPPPPCSSHQSSVSRQATHGLCLLPDAVEAASRPASPCTWRFNQPLFTSTPALPYLINSFRVPAFVLDLPPITTPTYSSPSLHRLGGLGKGIITLPSFSRPSRSALRPPPCDTCPSGLGMTWPAVAR